MESIRGMMIDIPVVETDTEASLEKAKADRDPPHPHTSPRWISCSFHASLLTMSLLGLRQSLFARLK